MIANSAKGLVLLISMSSVAVHQSMAADIEPPKVQLVDKFGVNMANGQVTHSMEIVSIGGAMGLSDSISVYANEFNFLGYRGFSHKYFAQARNVELSQEVNFSPRNIMRVYDPSGSADFAYYVGSTLQETGSATSGYSYRPVGDERHILEVNGDYLDWTKPDGTVVRFDRGSGTPKAANVGGILTSITYPNGLTVTVTSAGMSVNTNTGFQLKRVYEDDTRPMAKTDNPNLVNVPPYTTSSASGWSMINPRHVIGINAAVEYCAWTATTCSLTNTWPKATFDWPAGMPRTMYIGTSKVDVTDARGLTTTYGFTAYDLAFKEGGVVADGYVPGREYSPRLTSVSPPNASNRTRVTYDYKNVFLTTDFGTGTQDRRLQTSGVTKSAQRGGVNEGYDMLRPYYTDSQNLAYGGVNGVSLVHLVGHVNGATGVIYYAETDDGRITFEGTPRNFPVSFQKNAAPNETYQYTRGNLTSILYATGRSVAAEYPASCTSTTRKTCNQATRIRDANGNWTDYAYHAQSGQVSRITYPANKHGIRPETRYEYTQLSANYYNSSGTRTAGSPIWMKTAEKYCINSSSTGSGCADGDEVVTRFEYNHDNLLMTGMTVTDPGTGETLRTCYQYDIYGNQIGVTKPKANLSACP